MNIEDISTKELDTKNEQRLKQIKSKMRNTLYHLQDEYAQAVHTMNEDIRIELKNRISLLYEKIQYIKNIFKNN